MSEESSNPIVSRQTWVSLGTAIMLVIALIGATVWITDRLAELEGQIEQQGHRMDTRLTELEREATERYTLAQAAENALRTAVANPGLRVPDPRNPGQLFHVDRSDPGAQPNGGT